MWRAQPLIQSKPPKILLKISSLRELDRSQQRKGFIIFYFLVSDCCVCVIFTGNKICEILFSILSVPTEKFFCWFFFFFNRIVHIQEWLQYQITIVQSVLFCRLRISTCLIKTMFIKIVMLNSQLAKVVSQCDGFFEILMWKK